MSTSKVVFIIPGYEQLPTDAAYRKISRMLKKEGYQPIIINISWKNLTISESMKYFLKEFEKVEAKKKYILGFSLGAMIGFIASTKISVDGLILCSLSPYFKEDLPKFNIKRISKRKLQQYQEFSKFNCKNLSKRVKAKNVHMIYGAEEDNDLIQRVKLAYSQITVKHKYLIAVNNTEHNIGDRRYLSKIHQIFN